MFPSLSAKETGKAVREQVRKSTVKWNNINWRPLTLYIKMHENYWTKGELDKVRKYLPTKKSKVGKPPSIGTTDLELRFNFPYSVDYLNDDLKAQLMGLALEIGVVFLFRNFVYTFGRQIFKKMAGGPIGARLYTHHARGYGT